MVADEVRRVRKTAPDGADSEKLYYLCLLYPLKKEELWKILYGSNFESEVYPAGLCAERTLMFYAQANYADDPIETLAIASDPSERECYPCGQCRQVMVDVERRQGAPMRVIMSGGGTATAVDSAALLLPFTFVL